jgi:galactokinase/mevalonate kinase-like predicted kinase
MIRASAPGRCGIIGNPTDMYGGSVLSCTIPQRAYVTIAPADTLTLETNGETRRPRQRSDFRLQDDRFDIPRAVLSHLRLYDLGVRIAYTSDIPFRSGLSSSTALLAAVLFALQRYQGLIGNSNFEFRTSNRHHFAELARFIELNRLGIVCGYQDAYMVTFGGLNYMEFRDKEFYRHMDEEPYATIEPLTCSNPLPLIVAHTGVEHASGTVHKPIRERWLDGEAAVVEGYRRIERLAREGKRALLDSDWPRLGRLMNENHAIQRELGGSGPANERLIAAALAAGALGAKLAGAGSGGTIIALHPQPQSLAPALLAAGATFILYPQPMPGVQEEPVDEEQVDKEQVDKE